MRRKHRIVSWIAVLAMLLCIFPTAAFALEANEPQAAATGISINQTRNLTVGDSKPLILTANNGGNPPEVTWSSSNEARATVDQNGIVTGVATGAVTITATSKTDSTVTASVELLIRSNYKYSVGWSGSFTSDDNNTKTTAEIQVEANKLQQLWQANVGTGTIAIVDDYIYTYDGYDFGGSTSNPGTLYKIHKDTGEIEAQQTCNLSSSYYYAYTIYGGGLIYVSGVNKVMAVDPDSFTVLWYAEKPESTYPVIQFVNDHVIASGAVLNSTTGERVATLEGEYNYSSGVEKNGMYYVASISGKLYAFNTTTWKVADTYSFRTVTDGKQAGVMFFGDRLYWSDSTSGYIYSIQINSESGLFIDSSFKKTECGITTVCVPTAADGRIYLAGRKNGEGVVGVFKSSDLSLVYIAEGADGNIQSTPIVRNVVSGGSSIMSVDAMVPTAVADGNYVIVQDYGNDVTSTGDSRLYVLHDTSASVSGVLQKLTDISPVNFAYQQLACDKTGALYCTNDSGYLLKYGKALAQVPEISANLSTSEVRYGQGAAADELRITASVTDEGTLSYQWQSRTEGGDWIDLSGEITDSYTPSTAQTGTMYYRCIVTNTLDEQSAVATSKTAKITVVAGDPTKIMVTFRLIGASAADEDIDFSTAFGDYQGSEYETWIATASHQMTVGATVKDLVDLAMEKYDLTAVYSGGAVSSVTAPESLGGEALANGANGTCSFWMVAVNEDYNVNYAMTLADGDAVLLHYTNDYRYELAAFLPDGAANTYVDHWLKAEDVSPEGASIPGDVNADGKVNGTDVAFLKRNLAGWTGYESDKLDMSAADVNNDNKVNGTDVAFIKRHLAGWTGYETLL